MNELIDHSRVTRVSDLSRCAEDAWDEWTPESEWCEPSTTTIAASAAIGLFVAAGIYLAPHLIRYLNDRRM